MPRQKRTRLTEPELQDMLARAQESQRVAQTYAASIYDAMEKAAEEAAELRRLRRKACENEDQVIAMVDRVCAELDENYDDCVRYMERSTSEAPNGSAA